MTGNTWLKIIDRYSQVIENERFLFKEIEEGKSSCDQFQCYVFVPFVSEVLVID